MATGIKKLQRIQISKEQTSGTSVPANAVWRGTGNQLDDQRTINKVEEMVGVLTDTTRTNVSKYLGALSLNSCNATFEQLPILFAAALGGSVIGTVDAGPSNGAGGIITVTISGGVVTAFNIVNGGANYSAPPTLVLVGGSPTTTAVLTATLTAQVITGVTISSGGVGYLTAPTVIVVPPLAGSDSIYAFTLPAGTVPVASGGNSYTIYGGDNFEVEKMEYSVVTKIELSGDAGGEVKVSADWMGRQVQYVGATFPATSVISNPVEDILVQRGSLYLDAVGGSFGGTIISASMVGFKITFTFKWSPIFSGDAILYYSFPNFTGYEVSGEITFLHSTAASGTGSGVKTLFRAQTPQKMRLGFLGAAPFSTPGSLYTLPALYIDVPVTFSKVSPLGDKDGTSVLTASFAGGYNVTAGLAGAVTIAVAQRALTGVLS